MTVVAATIVLLLLHPVAGIAGAAAVAIVAHRSDHRAVRNAALVVAAVGILALVAGWPAGTEVTTSGT